MGGGDTDCNVSFVQVSPPSLYCYGVSSLKHTLSSLGSALGIAMMVGGGGAPPLAAWLGPDWIRAPGRAPS